MMGIFDQSTIPVLQEVVAFTEARHGVLAGNVANLDTPGYQVRDLSVDTFQERLRDLVDASSVESAEENSPGVLRSTSNDELRKVRDSMKSILYHDESNVGIEHQVLELSKNQYMHNVAVTIMSSQFRMLQTAVSERV
jgi:flagellar basal-body rod protein FlgB